MLPHSKVRKILDTTFGIVDEIKIKVWLEKTGWKSVNLLEKKGLPYWQAFCF
jgi:hypothetical protein